jgi:hypothetical protein
MSIVRQTKQFCAIMTSSVLISITTQYYSVFIYLFIAANQYHYFNTIIKLQKLYISYVYIIINILIYFRIK